ncbi:MAG: bifunctional metallophosphatase/5'-nucleotidase [Verrucomicrobiales bacterium]
MQAFSRREFLQLSGAAAVLGLLPHRLLASQDVEVVSIFHTTDLHGNVLPTATYDGTPDVGGFARCATQIKAWRETSPRSLTVDLGDLYQGTVVGYNTQGQVMIHALNHLDYDAWLLGNHEFDWGLDPINAAVRASRMPVLAANTLFQGKHTTAASQDGSVKPYVVKEVGGYKIVFIGLMTPGMPNWFLPEALPGFEVQDPVATLKKLMPEIRSHQPHAVVLGTHMGIRQRSREDDAANRLDALTREVQGIDLILGAHTHQEFAATAVNGVPYSQALYFGICAGKVDLAFDRNTKKLVGVSSELTTMDASVEPDPSVLALAQHDLQSAEMILQKPVGELLDELDIVNEPGQASDLERLICTAIIEGLKSHGHQVDGAIHGLLYAEAGIPSGPKTIGDMWKILPFENQTVLVDLTSEELGQMMTDFYRVRSLRSLVGLKPLVQGRGEDVRVRGFTQDGRQVDRSRRLRVALNSYDAASGGGRFEVVRELVGKVSSRRRVLPYQTRVLLTDYFLREKTVSLAKLLS